VSPGYVLASSEGVEKVLCVSSEVVVREVVPWGEMFKEVVFRDVVFREVVSVVLREVVDWLVFISAGLAP